MSHYYVSIPALDHKIFKYAGYHGKEDQRSWDEQYAWHAQNGANGSHEEINQGPYRVVVSDEYLGDRVDENLQPYGEPLHTPKKIILTKRMGAEVKTLMWSYESRPGSLRQAQEFARENKFMTHCFQLDEPFPLTKALNQHIDIEQHIAIEQAQKSLEERVDKWRQS
jgi:hypothetical protein